MTRALMKFFLRVGPILYMALIWLQSASFNPESFAEFSYTINKSLVLIIGICLELTHLFEFGILYFLLFLAFLTFGKIGKWKNRIAIFISLLYGLIDEIHQIYVPFRSFSIDDLIKDAIGILVIWWIVRRNYFLHQTTRFGLFLKKVEQPSKKDKSGVFL